MTSSDAVWLITGCSTGFGRELCRALLRRGYRVVVTARNPATLDEFALAGNALVAALDVTVPRQIADVVRQADERFGQIDVLVNNAGYGYLSAVEEGEDEEVRAMFETNVFGLANMTKAVLPGMRARRRGHIVNISSVGGLIGFPGIGYYNASKFAVEGLSEALAKETAGLDQGDDRRAGAVPHGLGGPLLKTPKNAIADYAQSAGARRAAIQGYSGSQQGDPVRGAEAIIQAVEAPQAPLHLLLGRPAFDLTAAKLKEFSAEMETWREVSLGADFPDAG